MALVFVRPALDVSGRIPDRAADTPQRGIEGPRVERRIATRIAPRVDRRGSLQDRPAQVFAELECVPEDGIQARLHGVRVRAPVRLVGEYPKPLEHVLRHLGHGLGAVYGGRQRRLRNRGYAPPLEVVSLA